MTKYSERTGRDGCYICSRGNSDILETHHLIPRRFGGSDTAANIVELCPTCHSTLERLYGDWFWATVNAISEERQLNIILDDILERLGGVHLELLLGLEEIKDDIEDDYRVNVDQAKQNAIENEAERNGYQSLKGTHFTIKGVIEDAQESYPDRPGAPEKVVINALCSKGIDRGRVENEIEKLCKKGDMYRPDDSHVRVV